MAIEPGSITTISRSIEPARTERSVARAPVGVLLVNLGTPTDPSVASVRRYLREFLSDRDVVDLPRIVWWPILNGVVLPFRAPASARLYESIWTSSGSPLLVNGRRQAELLAERLGPRFCVRLGMRYGEPSIPAAIDELCAAGCDSLVLFSLFPQYSASTSGSVYAAVYRALAKRRRQPALQVLPPYPTDPGYIRALAERVTATSQTVRVDHHVISFHGLPQAYVERGDPYRDQCVATADALARELGLRAEQWSLVFQSRFGRKPWLQPYADEFVIALAARSKRVLICMPGFTSDCLETLEEIGLRLREAFERAGGEELVVVPALNDQSAWIEAMARLVENRAAADLC